MKKIWIFLFIQLFFITSVFAANNLENRLKKDEHAFVGTKDNRINGKVPEGKIGQYEKTLLDQTVNGLQYSVFQVIRPAGRRAVVHYHPIPIVTCVLEGTTTLEMEGYKPHQYSAGQCFLMPANVKASNVNRGPGTVKLLDFQIVPVGSKGIIRLEKKVLMKENYM